MSSIYIVWGVGGEGQEGGKRGRKGLLLGFLGERRGGEERG